MSIGDAIKDAAVVGGYPLTGLLAVLSSVLVASRNRRVEERKAVVAETDELRQLVELYATDILRPLRTELATALRELATTKHDLAIERIDLAAARAQVAERDARIASLQGQLMLLGARVTELERTNGGTP